MPLVVPEESLEAFEALVGLDAEQRHSLLEALRNTAPAPSHAQFLARLPSIKRISRRTVRDIGMNLIALYVLREERGLSAEQIAADLVDAAEDIDLGDLEYTPEQKEQLTTFFGEIFSLDDTLGLTARAGDILIENENNFGNARIISELRPIFVDHGEPKPKGAMAVHMLKIEIHDSDRKYFFAMDSVDIQSLMDVLIRAQKKEVALKNLAAHAGLMWIER